VQHPAIPCVRIVCYLRRRTRQQACGAGGVVGVGRRGRLARTERDRRGHEASALAIRRLRVAGHHAGRNGRGLRQPDLSLGQRTMGRSGSDRRHRKNNRQLSH
jgi:hypothetical protein